VGSGSNKRELAALLAALAARLQASWDRLDDVLDELEELHGVSREEILDRLQREDLEREAEDENGPGCQAAPDSPD
jgi:hypothetical protein